VVLDPSSYAAAFPGPVHQEPYITHLVQWELPRIGAPFDVLLIDDFLTQLDGYKLALFPMTPNFSGEKVRKLLEGVMREGISTVWFHAPGCAHGDTELQGLIGWRWKYGTAGFPGVIIRNPHHWLTRGIEEGAEYGTLADIGRKRRDGYKWTYEENVSARVVIIDDDESVFIGALVSGEGVGLAVKETDGRFSVLSSAPSLNSRLLRNAAERSGVHIYGPLGDIVYAGRSFIGISAGFEGRHRVRLPERRRVVDLQTGEELGNAVTECEIELACGHCALLGTFPES
jgi:hypothetical protein